MMEAGNLQVSLSITSAYPEIGIVREGVLLGGEGPVSLRFLLEQESRPVTGETTALPVLIWAETLQDVAFGARGWDAWSGSICEWWSSEVCARSARLKTG